MAIFTTQYPAYITTPFELNSNLIVVKAKLNGFERNFFFDSGVSDLILNKKYVNKKNFIKGNKKFYGVNNAGSLTQTLLKNFNWNDLVIKNKIVDTIDIQHLEVALNQKIHGLIGYKQMRDYALNINYKTKTLSMWLDFEKSNFKVVQKVDFVMNRHIPIFSVNIGKKYFNMGLDTGAAGNLLHKKHQKKVSKHLKFLDDSTLSGGTTEVQKIKLYELDDLTANEVSYKKMKFLFSNIDHLNKSGYEMDGLLGYQFLKQRQTVINFPKCEIQFVRKKPAAK